MIDRYITTDSRSIRFAGFGCGGAAKKPSGASSRRTRSTKGGQSPPTPNPAGAPPGTTPNPITAAAPGGDGSGTVSK